MSKYQTPKGRIFESEISRYMIQRRIGSKEELRTLTTIGSCHTMSKYMDDPTLIPVGKLSEMFRALRIPKDEQIRIMSKIMGEG